MQHMQYLWGYFRRIMFVILKPHRTLSARGLRIVRNDLGAL